MTNDSLDDALEAARTASRAERIMHRDKIAKFGDAAIESLASWLRDPELAAFAVRTLGRIADDGNARTVLGALERELPHAPNETIKRDIVEQIDVERIRVGPEQTMAWLQMKLPGTRWTLDDAQLLIAKMRTLDARRSKNGAEKLVGAERDAAAAIQIADLRTAYVNHCWRCGSSIDSRRHARCNACRMFFCGSCGSCMCDFRA